METTEFSPTSQRGSKSKRKRKRSSKGNFNLSLSTNNSLSEKADTAELLYNTLVKRAPKDSTGVKRAFIEVSDDEIAVELPRQRDLDSTAALYGIEPASVATTTMPFALIPQREPVAPVGHATNFNRTLLRQALRRLVDEV